MILGIEVYLRVVLEKVRSEIRAVSEVVPERLPLVAALGLHGPVETVQLGHSALHPYPSPSGPEFLYHVSDPLNASIFGPASSHVNSYFSGPP
jgi:hypothetical protein